jgi:hypothetical protein
MTLIHHPCSDHQLAVITLDAGNARDIMLMLADAAAVISDLADGAAPAAARQAAAILDDTSSPYTLPALAAALTEVTNWLHRARRDATAHLPPGL